MLALHPRVVTAVWAAVEPRLPVVVDDHPLRCHRPRRDNFECFQAILFRLVTGCSWDVAGRLGKGSETTLRRRRDEWWQARVRYGDEIGELLRQSPRPRLDQINVAAHALLAWMEVPMLRSSLNAVAGAVSLTLCSSRGHARMSRQAVQRARAGTVENR